MITFDFDQLRGIGFTPAVAAQLGLLAQASGEPMRIVEVQRDSFVLHDGDTEHRARAFPWLVQDLQARGEACTIGDWVLVERDAQGEPWIAARVAPITVVARRANDGRRQLLASNVDTALLTMGLDADFNPRRMERYIAMVMACGVAPAAVLTKADIGFDVEHRVAELRDRIPRDVPILAVNGLSDAAREAIQPWLGAGQTLVLLGSSGAGKSTLTNTLTGESLQSTGGVRRSDGRGMHTTTARSLHRCAGGACIIDTPGLRTWQPDADERALAAAFADIDELAPQCRFRDCRHEGEPGCAVRGRVAPDRLLNFRKLMRDAQRSEMTPLQRIEQRRKWKMLGKAGGERARQKQGP